MASSANSHSIKTHYWNFGDLGLFLLSLAILTLSLHILTTLRLLPKDQLSHPSSGLQIAVVSYLAASFYAILRLRYRRPVLIPLGWVWPTIPQTVASLGTGALLGILAMLYQQCRTQSVALKPSFQLLLLASLLAPILEESLFRGCLLPLLADRAGNPAAVMVAAGVFTLFHAPTDLPHLVFFMLTGVAYGWIKVVSRTTTASALAHSAYNLILLSAALWIEAYGRGTELFCKFR